MLDSTGDAVCDREAPVINNFSTKCPLPFDKNLKRGNKLIILTYDNYIIIIILDALINIIIINPIEWTSTNYLCHHTRQEFV